MPHRKQPVFSENRAKKGGMGTHSLCPIENNPSFLRIGQKKEGMGSLFMPHRKQPVFSENRPRKGGMGTHFLCPIQKYPFFLRIGQK